MNSISWLHLTDLHRGMRDEQWVGKTEMHRFFEDLPELYDKSGPWDLVLFTGDLTQRGKAEEFQGVNEFLARLWSALDKQDPKPVLVAVPGNHDLSRPDPQDPAAMLLLQWGNQPEVQSRFWSDPNSPYRGVVANAFANYVEWWSNQPLKPKDCRIGPFPGDIAVTIEKQGYKLGVLGLNTALLQLGEDDYKGRLSLHNRQFHEACGNDGVAWAEQHDFCLLLTHHPPSWLSKTARDFLSTDIIDGRRFAVHLCGHRHDLGYRENAEGGLHVERTWQGRSLFGLEYYGDKLDRSHGYCVGRLSLTDDQTGELVFWPRWSQVVGSRRKFIPDHSVDLIDEHTRPAECDVIRTRKAAPSKSATGSVLIESTEPETVMEAARLVVPTGAVPLGSPLYVRRQSDSLLESQLRTKASITTVLGARQMGKTSALIRGTDLLKKQDLDAITIDFQEAFDASRLTNLDSFLRSLANLIADQMSVNFEDVDRIWAMPLTPKIKMSRFVEDLILESTRDYVVLILDEADLILSTSFYTDFFALLRAWHNRSAAEELWQRLSIVIAVSTLPSLLISNLSQSPFNVGCTIKLLDFGEDQVRDLNQRYNSPLAEQDIPEAMELLGGHPYLTRQALYTMVSRKIGWAELSELADQDSGPFEHHLRYYWNLLQNDPKLKAAARMVIREQKCPDGIELLRLIAACLVREQDGGCCCRYGLHKRFFGSRL